MGIEKLRVAASAAGFAMANSDDLLISNAVDKKEEPSAWLDDTRDLAGRSASETVAATSVRERGFREWWLLLWARRRPVAAVG